MTQLILQKHVHYIQSSLYSGANIIVLLPLINSYTCLTGWFGINYPSAFWKFWHCPSKMRDLIANFIRRSIDQFPWDNRFSKIDVNQKENLFNQSIKNIQSNFIPHETVTCDDRDFPWINRKIKGLIWLKWKV